MDQQAEKKDKTERITGQGRKTREEIVNWNQMTALKFQTGGETSDIPGLPSGVSCEKAILKSIIIAIQILICHFYFDLF